MTRSKVLVDSSFLYTLFDHSSAKHAQAYAFTQLNTGILYIPDVVLVEVAFLANRAGGVPATIKLLDYLASFSGQLERLESSDLAPIRRIMATYADAEFDFVDCAIMALAERLNITQVLTYDRRDFSIFRPTHCPYLDLLP